MRPEDEAVLYIEIRLITSGERDAFASARRAIRDDLALRDGVADVRMFTSFFTFSDVNPADVAVTIVECASAAHVEAAMASMQEHPRWAEYAEASTLLSHATARSVDGLASRIGSYVPGGDHVLEVAVRVPTVADDLFWEARREFFGVVAEQPGYVTDHEFVDVYSGARVVLIAWESRYHFERALTVLQTRAEMERFFEKLKASAYHALVQSE